MSKGRLHDPKCHELAEYFLSDSPALRSKTLIDDLAQTIQDTIEDWIERTDEERIQGERE